MRKAVNLAVICEGEILLVRKKDVWILPGGKPKKEESNLDCLVREFKEELSGTKIIINSYYKPFVGETPYKKDNLKAEVYFGKIKEKLGKPSSEIRDRRFVSDFEKYNLSDITEKIINSLIEDNYL